MWACVRYRTVEEMHFRPQSRKKERKWTVFITQPSVELLLKKQSIHPSSVYAASRHGGTRCNRVFTRNTLSPSDWLDTISSLQWVLRVIQCLGDLIGGAGILIWCLNHHWRNKDVGSFPALGGAAYSWLVMNATTKILAWTHQQHNQIPSYIAIQTYEVLNEMTLKLSRCLCPLTGLRVTASWNVHYVFPRDPFHLENLSYQYYFQQIQNVEPLLVSCDGRATCFVLLLPVTRWTLG